MPLPSLHCSMWSARGSIQFISCTKQFRDAMNSGTFYIINTCLTEGPHPTTEFSRSFVFGRNSTITTMIANKGWAEPEYGIWKGTNNEHLFQTNTFKNICIQEQEKHHIKSCVSSWDRSACISEWMSDVQQLGEGREARHHYSVEQIFIP